MVLDYFLIFNNLLIVLLDDLLVALDGHFILPLADVKYEVGAFTLLVHLLLEVLLLFPVIVSPALNLLSHGVVLVGMINLLLQALVFEIEFLKSVSHE